MVRYRKILPDFSSEKLSFKGTDFNLKISPSGWVLMLLGLESAMKKKNQLFLAKLV